MIQFSFYEELEQFFDNFPKYHTNNLLGDFTAKLKRNDICKPTIGNESLLRDSNDDDDDVRIVKFATSKIWLLRARSHHTEIFVNKPGPLLRGRLTTRLITY